MTSPLQDQLQRTLGDGYTIERELGGGGMSRVFVATEKSLGRRVVVKVLPPDLAAGVSTERFRREILLAASLQHPHIVPRAHRGLVGRAPVLHDAVRGGRIAARAPRARGPAPVRDAVRILRDVAQALAYAHANGVLHRDIKPENILLSGGVAMVTDFGVAKAIVASRGRASGTLTQAGLALGTPAYMAPEQGDGRSRRAISARTSTPSARWRTRCSCGKALFAGRSPQQLLMAHVMEAPKPVRECRPDTPPALAALIMRLPREGSRQTSRHGGRCAASAR